MYNFNNKKNKENLTSFPQNNNNSYIGHQEPEINGRAQQTPTQCLLLISQLEGTQKATQDYSYELEQVQVTPWINMPFRIKKDKNSSKSKTSTLLASCDEYSNVSQKERNEKQNRVSFTKKDSRKQIKLIHKNTESIKNIQSANARYSHRNEDPGCLSKQFSNKNLKQHMINLKTNNSSHQVAKISSSGQKSSLKKREESRNKNTQYNNENWNEGFEFSRFEENLKGMRGIMNSTGYKNSCNYSILRQNTAIVNEAKAVSLFSCAQPQCFQESGHKQNIENIQIHEKQGQIWHKNEQGVRQLSIFRKGQFQNILSEAQKKSSEYNKIKTKILESIKKQTVMREGMKMDINKSKKMLGRYFKQIQQKKPKKRKTELSISSGTKPAQNAESGFEHANPLSKHLYDKYRLLLTKHV